MDPTPCSPDNGTLAIINAIFNGFQILALMVLTHYQRRNGHHERNDREERDRRLGP